jgi:hypothetical protein
LRIEDSGRRDPSARLAVAILGLACTLASALPLSAQVPSLCASPTIRSVANGSWGTASTWDQNRVPTITDDVNVRHVLTYTRVEAECLDLDGELHASRTQDSTARVGTTLVDVAGWLDLGTTASPLSAGVTAEYVIANLPLDLGLDPEQFGIGILVRGRFTSHGAPKTPWLRLSGEPAQGQSSLPLGVVPVGWFAGDRLVIPDSRQKEPPYVPSFVTYSGGTSVSPFPQAHKGVRDLTGTLRFLPHVGNLSRNVVIRSENPAGTRGHVLVTENALVDLRWTRFADLGRTKWEGWLDSTTFDSFGNLTKIGTNQIGRYGIHLHHLKTKAVLVGLAIERVTKWGVAIHDSHFSSLTDSVIVDAGGASVMTEDGSETGNIIARNLIVLSKGTGSPDSAGRGFKEFGFEGSCLWLAGPFNLVRDNVCANAWALGYTVMPFAPALVDTPNGKRNVNAFPLVEFARNEVYASYYGGQFWDVGARSADYSFTVPGESVVKDLVGWNLAKRGIYHYPTNRLTYDGLVLLNDPAMVWTNPVGLDFGDYSQRNVTIKNSELSGFRTCVAIPNKMGDVRDPYGKTATPMRIEDSQLDCQNGAISGTQWGVVGGGAYLAPRTVVVRNVRFPQRMPGSVFTLGFSTVSDAGVKNSSGPRFNLIVKDEFFVESYNGNPGDDFQIYQDGQEPNRIILQSFNSHVGSPDFGLTNTQNWAKNVIAIAGSITPCLNTRADILGFTCGGSQPPPPPPPTPTEEICGDDKDNDGDGLIDEGCEVQPPPPPPPPPNPEPTVDCPVTISDPICLVAAPSTVAVGEPYEITVRIFGDDVHVVKLDGLYPFMQDALCDGPAEGATTTCEKTVTRTPTTGGVVTHTVTAVHRNGAPWPSESVTVTVENPSTPPPGEGWESPQFLTASESPYFGIGAAGSKVVVANGTGTVYVRRSESHGAEGTWGNWTPIGAGTIVPERAVAVSGSTVLIGAGGWNTGVFTDFCCQRTGRSLLAYVSRDGGQTYQDYAIAPSARMIRYSVAIDPVTTDLHIVWMQAVLNPNGSFKTWDVAESHWFNGAGGWSAPRIVMAGVNATGEQRPSVAAYGGVVVYAWMSGADNKSPCTIEGGGITIPQCTEIRVSRSADRGVTLGPPRRVTNSTAYAGRPSLLFRPDGIALIAFDQRIPGQANDIATLVSGDNGQSWAGPFLVDPWAGESTHALLTYGPDGQNHLAQMDQRGGSTYRLFVSASPNGQTWGPLQQLSATDTPAPQIAATDAFILTLTTDDIPGRLVLRRLQVVP